MGCVLTTSSGQLFAGSSVGTWSGFGALSPLASALVALGARGGEVADIVSATWAATPSSSKPDVDKLRAEDEGLLRELAPGASFAALGS